MVGDQTSSANLTSRPRLGALLAVSSGLVLAVLPIFLVAGFAPQIRNDLELTGSELGLSITVAFMAGAFAAVPIGRVTDRLGSGRAVSVGAGFSIAALVGLGVFTEGLVALIMFLALAGLAIAFVDTGFALLISVVIPKSRRGLAFGVKEAAIPAASLGVALSIPILASNLGWRWSTSIGVLFLAVLIVTFPSERKNMLQGSLEQTTGDDAPSAPLIRRPVLAALAAGLGTAAATGVAVFLTESAVAAGMSPTGAGALLAVAGVSGIITKVGVGLGIDNRPKRVSIIVSLMMLTGSVAMVLGSVGVRELLFPAAIGTFAGGAGWSGLLLFALVESRPHAAGRAAGVGIAGLAIGSAIGPLAFGLAIDHASLTIAWAGAAMSIGIGALVMLLAGRSSRAMPQKLQKGG